MDQEELKDAEEEYVKNQSEGKEVDVDGEQQISEDDDISEDSYAENCNAED